MAKRRATSGPSKSLVRVAFVLDGSMGVQRNQSGGPRMSVPRLGGP